MASTPYLLTYDPDRFTHKEWALTDEHIQQNLVPENRSGTVELSLQGEAMNTFLESIANEIQKDPQDARFTIKEGRVTQFAPSEQGITLHKEKTIKAILDLWKTTENKKDVAIVTEETAPDITTSAVNDLGIVELLGMGMSNFAGSPNNRIKNIENGVRLLKGRLIKPNKEFSLLEALGPFTAENGYLPELVIRGDEIIPEYGGGLCQIGSTTFRAVMNSGMKITQRQNHSLVVSYYNDPSNGNPGTDATIYDPAPDFRFINDTEQTVLFQTEMDVSTGDLRFSFWGTSDGRKGSYSAPVVERWIPVGETRYMQTANLEHGKEKCQSSHVGAAASFTYSVEGPDGSIEETIFTSHYRPLPRICLVGIQEEKVEETTENKNTEITDSNQQTEEKKEEAEEEKVDEVSTPAQQP